MPRAGRESRTRVWALGAAFAVTIAVGMVLSSGIWSAASARTSWTLTSADKDASCGVGTNPTYLAYDPVNHEVYVPNAVSSNVSVIKAPCTVVANITLPYGSEPVAAAFDPQNNYMYVTDQALNEVYLISGTKIVKTLNGSEFDGPYGVVYDPAYGAMVVTEYGSNEVSVIRDTTFEFNVHAGIVEPEGIDYDPYWGFLDVGAEMYHNVTILDASNFSHVASVSVGFSPGAIAYDPADFEDYVTNAGSNSVSVLNGTVVKHTITGPVLPRFAAWSQAKLAMYVTSDGWLFVIRGNSVVQKISTPGDFGIAYDDATNNVYVTAYVIPGFVYVYST